MSVWKKKDKYVEHIIVHLWDHFMSHLDIYGKMLESYVHKVLVEDL